MKKITLEKAIFSKLIDTVKECVAKDDSRPALRYIKIEVEPETITAIAVDGFRMAKIELKHGNADVEPFDFVLKPLVLSANAKNVEIELVDGCAEITVYELFGKLKYFFEQPKAEFFNHKQIVDEKVLVNDNYICFNAKYMIECLKSFCGKSRNNQCELHHGESKVSPFYLISNNDDEKVVKLILPIRK